MAVVNGSSSDILAAILVCPGCRQDLAALENRYVCQGCGKYYPIDGEIPCLAEPVRSDDNAPQGVSFRQKYEWQYQRAGQARDYDESFRLQPRKRQRTRRELQILERMLASRSRCHSILDVPCGGGRLSGPISARTEHLIEADISPAQLDLALGAGPGNQRGLIISALALPFEDGSFDAAVCARLSHHLPDPGERETLLLELLRVSRSFVIFSFTDRSSLQSAGRRLRGKELNPCAMSGTEITRIAGSHHAEIDRIMTVSNLGPRHRYALIVKR